MIITGATGKIGAEVSRILDSENLTFTALSRRKEKLVALNLPHMKIIEGTMEDSNNWMEQLNNGAQELLFLVRVNDSLEILKSAKKHGINKIVFLSSASINHKNSSDSQNAIDHKIIEDKIKEMGFEYVFIRPEAFMGNAHYWSSLFKYSKNEIKWPELKAKYASVHERDVAEVIVKVLKSFSTFEGKILTLTGANVITQKYMLDEIIRQTASKLQLHEQSLAEFETYMSRYMDKKYILLREEDWQYSLNNKLELTDTISNVLGREPLTYREWVAENLTIFEGVQ